MYEIRQATVEDSAGLAKTQVDSYLTAYASFFPPSYFAHFNYAEQEQEWGEIIASNTKDILLVARSEKDDVVGYVLARAKPDIFPGYDAEIIALHVRKSFQKNGIGKALINKAVARLIDDGCKSVMLWTLKKNTSRDWYEKLDGKLLAEKTDTMDEWDISEVAYGWQEISTLAANTSAD